MSDISKRLKDTVSNDKYSFHSSMTNSVTNIIDVQIVPWLHQCFQKYPPNEFHKRMAWRVGQDGRLEINPKTGKYIQATYEFDGMIYPGFDYIGDWQKYHRKIFIAFKMARRMKKYLNLDGTKLYNTIVGLLNDKGYYLKNHEMMCIKHTIAKVMRLIYL